MFLCCEDLNSRRAPLFYSRSTRSPRARGPTEVRNSDERRESCPREMTKPSRCFSIAQLPLQCECAHNRTERPTKQLPHCAPSALCATSNAIDAVRLLTPRTPHSAAAGTTPPPATRSFPSRTAARQDMRPPVSDRSQLPSRHPEQDAACACTHSHTARTHEDHAACSWDMRPSFSQRQLVHTA